MATPRKKPEDKLKVGAKSTYTEEMGARICSLIATHAIGQTSICEMFPDLPNTTTIHEWRYKHPEFGEKYMDAKKIQATLYAESMVDFALEKNIIVDSDGNQKYDPGHAAWVRNNLNARIWHVSKLRPKMYGDKAQKDESETKDETIEKLLAIVSSLQKKHDKDV